MMLVWDSHCALTGIEQRCTVMSTRKWREGMSAGCMHSGRAPSSCAKAYASRYFSYVCKREESLSSNSCVEETQDVYITHITGQYYSLLGHAKG